MTDEVLGHIEELGDGGHVDGEAGIANDLAWAQECLTARIEGRLARGALIDA